MDVNHIITSSLCITSLILVVIVYYNPVITALVLIASICVSRYWKTLMKTRLPCTDKCVVITGCDSGFGNGLAKFLDKAGCTVIAGCLNPEQGGSLALRSSCSDNLHVVKLDVTSDESIVSFRKEAERICGPNGIWGLVNNAGMQYFGEADFLPVEYFYKNMDVNYFGLVKMCKTFIPLLRKSKGRIVNVTSVLGLYSVKYRATYSPSKHAAESFSDILRREMKKFDIEVCLVEPGDFGDITNIQQQDVIRKQNEYTWNQCSPEIRDHYSEDYIKTVGLKHCYNEQKALKNNMKYVLHAIDDALFSSHPDIRYLVDGRGHLLDKYCWVARIQPLLPGRLLDIIVEQYL